MRGGRHAPGTSLVATGDITIQYSCAVPYRAYVDARQKTLGAQTDCVLFSASALDPHTHTRGVRRKTIQSRNNIPSNFCTHTLATRWPQERLSRSVIEHVQPTFLTLSERLGVAQAELPWFCVGRSASHRHSDPSKSSRPVSNLHR